jgi:hypothetical protein
LPAWPVPNIQAVLLGQKDADPHNSLLMLLMLYPGWKGKEESRESFG